MNQSNASHSAVGVHLPKIPVLLMRQMGLKHVRVEEPGLLQSIFEHYVDIVQPGTSI